MIGLPVDFEVTFGTQYNDWEGKVSRRKFLGWKSPKTSALLFVYFST